MPKLFISVLASALVLALQPVPGSAQQDHPIQLSLVTPIQIVPEGESVRGVRINVLYGRNAFMTGFDYGLVNHTVRDFLGVGLGIVNLTEGDAVGFQAGIVNMTEGAFEGVQWGTVNAATRGHGAQIGVVNHSRNYRGLQFGLVNYAEAMHGVQIGFVNIIKRGGAFPVMVLANWSLDEGRRPN